MGRNGKIGRVSAARMPAGCMLAGCMLATVVCSDVAAQEENVPRINLGLGLVYDDNANRASGEPGDPEESDTQRQFNLGVGIDGDTKHLGYVLNYQATDSAYENDTFGDRTSVNGYGELRVFSADRRYSWVFSNTETDTVVDVAAADTPDNRQQRSRYATGPELQLRFSPRDTLILSGRYSTLQVDADGTDSDRTNGNVTWQRMVSPKLTLALDATYESVEFEQDDLVGISNDFSNDYDRQTASLNIVRRIRHGQINLNAGYSVIDRSILEDDVKSPVYGLNVTLRGFGGENTLNALRSLTDNTAGLNRGLQATLGIPNVGNTGTETDPDFGGTGAQIVIREQLVLGHKRLVFSPRNTLGFGVSWNEREEEDSGQVESRQGVELNFERTLSPATSLRLNVGYNEFERSDDTDEVIDRRKNAGLVLTSRINEKLFYNCSITYFDRTGEILSQYTSNSISCGINYNIR